MAKIKDNGTVSFLTVTGGGIDSSGNPIAVSETWTEPIPCHIDTVTDNTKGTYEDGKFRQQSYKIFLEIMPVDSTKVRLTNNEGKHLGDFQIQRIEKLDRVKRIRIVA